MSKVAITGNASGTGVFTIAAPNTNTDRTLTLPDEVGTVLTSASDVAASQITTALNATGSAPLYACRAWVNFDGTTNTGGNCDIRSSGNVSSVTDNGTGDYTVNFTTAMPDANYSVSVGHGSTGSYADGVVYNQDGTYGTFTNYFRFATVQPSAYVDPSNVFVAIFR